MVLELESGARRSDKSSIFLNTTSLLWFPSNDVADLVIDVLQTSLHRKEFKIKMVWEWESGARRIDKNGFGVGKWGEEKC